MRALDLFSGIGGFALGGRMVWGDEYEVVSFCEIDPFCRGILNRHWPNVPVHDDIKTMKGGGFGAIDIITGGDPCQPHSQAGKRKGKEDHRYLWPEMLHIIEEARPCWVINENVVGSISNGVVDQKCDDLERAGYTCQPFNIPALAVGAWHFRQRVWIVGYSECGGQPGNARRRAGAQPENGYMVIGHTNSTDRHQWPVREIQGKPYSKSTGTHAITPDPQSPKQQFTGHSRAGRNGSSDGNKSTANPNGAGLAQRESIGSDAREKQQAVIGGFWEDHWLEAATRFCAISDGVPRRVVRRREKIKAAGNAIVPQVAAVIMQAIRDAEQIISK